VAAGGNLDGGSGRRMVMVGAVGLGGRGKIVAAGSRVENGSR
jgi:hypothetical protein